MSVHEARAGRVFARAGYMDESAGLRDRLKVAPAGAPAEGEPAAARGR